MVRASPTAVRVAPSSVCPASVPAEEIPLAFDAGDGAVSAYPLRVVCVTCHFAHGTSSTGQAGLSGVYGENVPAGDTSLVRLKGGAVCQTCHQKKQ